MAASACKHMQTCEHVQTKLAAFRAAAEDHREDVGRKSCKCLVILREVGTNHTMELREQGLQEQRKVS